MTAASVWCVPAFADSSHSWRVLLDSPFARRHDVRVIDLPGVGVHPPPAKPASIDDMAEHVASTIAGEGAHGLKVIVGHSLGSTIAVRACGRLPGVVAGLLSIEGNLTRDDGYFSGMAADHDTPEPFVTALTARVAGVVEAGGAPRSYLESIRRAEPKTIWELGCDAAAQGHGDRFGGEYRGVSVPTRYLWSAASTPTATQRYIAAHDIDNRRNDTARHWPLEDAARWLVELMDGFIEALPHRASG